MPLNRHSPSPDYDRQPRLRGDSVCAGYNGRQVLTNVDFTVHEGSVTVLLGPNGSGKSTLLKTLARTLAPSAGKVLLDGNDIHRQPTRTVAQQLGILPQSPTAPDGLTVRELVGLGRFPYQSLMRQQVFDLDAQVIREPLAGRPVCVPVKRTVAETASFNSSVATT